MFYMVEGSRVTNYMWGYNLFTSIIKRAHYKDIKNFDASNRLSNLFKLRTKRQHC